MPSPLLSVLMPFIKPALSAALSSRLNSKKDISDTINDVVKGLTTQSDEMNAAMLEVNKGQQEINKIEAGNRSVFIAGWRPATGWACAIGVAYTFVIGPLFVAITQTFGINVVLPVIPQDVLFELLFAMLGMAGLRSFDKLKGLTK